MQQKPKTLPTLAAHRSRTTLQKDKSKIEDLLARNNPHCNDYRHQQEYAQIAASNFISRVDTVNTPAVILAIADQLKHSQTRPEPQHSSYQ